jgi:hypothetical protein
MSQERIGGIDRRALPDKTMALRRAHDRNTHLRLQTPDHVALSTLDGHRHGNPDPSHTEGRITDSPHSPRRELAETAAMFRCELMTRCRYHAPDQGRALRLWRRIIVADSRSMSSGAIR